MKNHHAVPAVVTDARLRMAVNIIRSLGRAGVPVTAVETAGRENVLGFHSRYTRARVRLPLDSSAADLAAVASGAVYVPVSTAMVALLARHQEQALSPVSTLVPPTASLALLHDKASCLKLARDKGLPVPATRVPAEEGVDPSDRSELLEWAASLTFPVIVKYRSGEDVGLPAAKRYLVCRTRDEVADGYLRLNSVQPGPIVQDYVDGGDVGLALLYDRHSEPVASFTYRSLRQRPRAGGPTTLAESVSLPTLVDYGKRLLDGLAWRGPVMLDFREDSRGGYHLLEVNPRFWGSLDLAVRSGVDFPLLYYLAALGLPLPRMEQRDGVRVRFFPNDFLSVFEYARAERAGPLQALGWLLELANPALPDGLLALSDPAPGLLYLIGGLTRRRAGHHAIPGGWE